MNRLVCKETAATVSQAYEKLTKTWQASAKVLKVLETKPDTVKSGFTELQSRHL